MSLLRDHHHSLLRTLPRQTAHIPGIVPQHLKVRLRQELVIQHPLGEGEAVPLDLPQFDLVHHRAGQHRVLFLQLAVRVHPQEGDDLVGSDARAQSLSDRVAGEDRHGEVRQPVDHLAEEADQGDL